MPESMPFGSLWLPVVASAVAVFLASSVIHMVLRYHRADFRRLPDEDAVGEALRAKATAPGLYQLPYCTQGDMNSPEAQERYRRGPVALVAVMRPGVPSLGRYLGMWFGLCLLVSFVAGYVARHSLAPAEDGLTVMRITGTVAFAAHGLGRIQDSIWHAVPWPNTVRGLLDALVYALLTGLVFRLLWPA